MKIYWIWEPTPGVKIGITENGKLISTKSIVTEKDIMTTFIVPKNRPVLDSDIENFENKKQDQTVLLKPGHLPKKYIDETYRIIDDYYKTIKDYQPTITPITPEKTNPLPHGVHYIITPPRIQTDEEGFLKIREVLQRLSQKSKKIPSLGEKIEELQTALSEAGLSQIKVKTNYHLDTAHFYFNCCGFRWACTTHAIIDYEGGNTPKTIIDLVFSPRHDLDVLMFYDKMKNREIWVSDLEAFRKEFEETLFIKPTDWQPVHELDKIRERILNRSYDYVRAIAEVINTLAQVWIRTFEK